VKSLYRVWAETNQSVFYVDTEQVAVADNFVASLGTMRQQVWGKALTLGRVTAHLPGLSRRRS
jgi:hypothetical protein